jgi:CheY-like chemotaxis protein
MTRLLVVDDNHDAADSLGLSALSAALSLPPDAMLVDLRMPGMDGFRLAEFVRREESLRKTLLIAVTGLAGPAIERPVWAAGFDHYLLKPVTVYQILDLLRGARSLLRGHTEDRRELVDEIAEMARRQSEIAAAAENHLRKNGRPKPPGLP